MELLDIYYLAERTYSNGDAFEYNATLDNLYTLIGKIYLKYTIEIKVSYMRADLRDASTYFKMSAIKDIGYATRLVLVSTCRTYMKHVGKDRYNEAISKVTRRYDVSMITDISDLHSILRGTEETKSVDDLIDDSRDDVLTELISSRINQLSQRYGFSPDSYLAKENFKSVGGQRGFAPQLPTLGRLPVEETKEEKKQKEEKLKIQLEFELNNAIEDKIVNLEEWYKKYKVEPLEIRGYHWGTDEESIAILRIKIERGGSRDEYMYNDIDYYGREYPDRSMDRKRNRLKRILQALEVREEVFNDLKKRIKGVKRVSDLYNIKFPALESVKREMMNNLMVPPKPEVTVESNTTIEDGYLRGFWMSFLASFFPGIRRTLELQEEERRREYIQMQKGTDTEKLRR